MTDLAIFSADNWIPFVEKTMADYRQFSAQQAPEDAKSFMVYHNACKAVLGHLLMIRKMMETESVSTDTDALLALMAEARKEDIHDDTDSFE